MATERIVQFDCKICGRKYNVTRFGDAYEEPVYCCGVESVAADVPAVVTAAGAPKKPATKKPAKKKAVKKAKKPATKAAKKASKKAKKKPAKKAVKKKTAKKKASKRK